MAIKLMADRKPKDGKQWYRVKLDYNVPGQSTRKQIRRYVLGLGEARDVERDFLNKRAANELPGMQLTENEGAVTAVETFTVDSWFARWLEQYREEHPNSRTPASYTAIVRRYLIPVIGSRPLEAVSADDVRLVLRSDTVKAVSGMTRLHVYRVLFQGLDAARKDGHLVINPATRVPAPKVDKFEPHVITLDEGRRLIDLSKGSEIETLIVVLSYTGLRLGEALGLRWIDVDLDTATISVRQTRKLNAPVLYGEPKTKSSRAPVALSGPVIEALRSHREAQREHFDALRIAPDHGLVFTDALGNGMRHDYVARRWEVLREKASIPRARIHDLRHFTGTHLLSLGVDPVTVASVLRHSSPIITMNTYAHVVPNAARQAVEKLASAIGAGQ